MASSRYVPFGMCKDGTTAAPTSRGSETNFTVREVKLIVGNKKKNRGSITLHRGLTKPLKPKIHEYGLDDDAPWILTKDNKPFVPVDLECDQFVLDESTKLAVSEGSTLVNITDGNAELDVAALATKLSKKYHIPYVQTRVAYVLSLSPFLTRAYVQATNAATQQQIAAVDERVTTLGNQVNERVATLENQVNDQVTTMGIQISQLQNQVRELTLNNSTTELESRIIDTNSRITTVETRTQESIFQALFHHSVTEDLNVQLRSPHLYSQGLQIWTSSMFGAMNGLPPFLGRVYRGIDARYAPDGFVQKLIANGVYCDPAFTCTSRKIEIAMEFAVGDDREGIAVLLYIEQYSGRYIADYVAPKFKHEEEVLLYPSTPLYVKATQSVQRQFGDKRIQCLEVLVHEGH